MMSDVPASISFGSFRTFILIFELLIMICVQTGIRTRTTKSLPPQDSAATVTPFGHMKCRFPHPTPKPIDFANLTTCASARPTTFLLPATHLLLLSPAVEAWIILIVLQILTSISVSSPETLVHDLYKSVTTP